jgi:IclR helix-turn-helix domain
VENRSLVEEVRAVRERVAARLRELEPLVREYQELLLLAGELGIVPPGGDDPAPAGGGGGDDRGSLGAGDGDDAGPAGAGADASAGEPSEPSGPDAERKPVRRRRPRPASDAVPASDPELEGRVLEALRAQPGATITDLASALALPATSLYRPVRELASSGAVVKRGRGLYAES